MSVAGGLANAFERARTAGCVCMQIFAKNPRQWVAKRLGRGQAAAFRAAGQDLDVWPVMAHGSYLVNLAASDRSVRRRSLSSLRDDLARSEVLGIAGVVIHPGSHRGRGLEEGIARIAESINRILDQTAGDGSKIVLETTSGQGQGVGSRFEHIAAIIELVEQRRRLGVCLDTCHVFAAGYDVRRKPGYERMWREFDAAIGMRRLEVIHLNDCKGGLGEHLDRHEHIGMGGLGLNAFRLVMRDPRLAHVPKIIETPKGDKDDGVLDRRNLGILRRLAGRA